MANKKVTRWGKAYLVLRWPVVFGLLFAAVVFFLLGLLNSLGYNGTTNLRPISQSSKQWQDFTASFAKGEPAHAGVPFEWKNQQPQDEKNGLIKFDTRLVSVLTYLKNAKGKSLNCGWDGQHELLTLDIDSSSQWSTYSTPPEKPIPLSTIDRGVGVRIYQADYIKCTEYPRYPSHPELCSEAPTPKIFPSGSNGFPISLSSDDLIQPDMPYDSANCRVSCAVDYYPLLPDPNKSSPPAYNDKIKSLAGFDPAATVFEYEDITSMSRKVALLKVALLAYELMHIDDKGCASPKGNSGYDRVIPISLIVQDWVREDLKDGWNDLVQTAQEKFPNNFQDSSRLAGLAADPVLNILGLHFNF